MAKDELQINPRQTQVVVEELMQTNERISIMLDTAPISCTLWDKDSKIIDCNEETVRLFGVKDKREFQERFFELSPEYQPDGQRSGEQAVYYVQKTYAQGKCVFEWMHNTMDGILFPAEVTLIRGGMESTGYTVAGYTRDLREQKRMTQEIEKRGLLLDTVNQVANILLQSESGSFDANMLHCIGMMGKAVGADRVSIWKNYHKDNKLHCLQINEWAGGELKINPNLKLGISYNEIPGWEKILSRGDCINSLVRDMSVEEKAMLSPDEVLSIFVVPVFAHENKFWGFVCFEICREERMYSETEQSILRSGGLLIANAFIRYEMIQNIHETAALLKQVVTNYPGAIWSVDRNEVYTLFNGRSISKYGVTPEQVVGKSFDNLPPSIKVPEIFDYIRKTYTHGEQEWITRTEPGTFHIRTSPVYDDNGNITGVVGNSDEITEIIRLQDELKDALDKANAANSLKNTAIKSLESILNSIDAMIYTTVPETGEILFVNNYMKKRFRKSNEELIGAYCYKVFRGLDKMCDFCPCHRLSKEPEAKIVWDENETTSRRHLRHSDCLIDWPNGEKIHLQHAVEITELVNAREAAEQSNRSKGIFIAQMSHEIRTPMNAILGVAEIQLREERLSAVAEEGFRRIYDSGNLLLNIINDILDFSKIDAGKMEIVPNKYDIPSLINNTVQLSQLRYESKPIDFILNIDENTPLELVGDELRIRQILNNLLSNAFKYTSAGVIKMSVTVEPGSADEDETVILVISVSDTGQGMRQDQLDRLFDAYARFNMETNQGIPGTGLGLNITKHLIDMMGGKISVESEEGRGSVFTVRLPQKNCGSGVCGPGIMESLQDFGFNNTSISKKTHIVYEYMPYGRVLVVDDVESNLYVARGLMAPYGLHIETAKSGAEAVAKIKSGNVYDVVFMDHMMPVMDGIKAAKILRDCGYKHPIVALTANAISGQSEMFLTNGFDRFISKPIDSRELDLVLKELIRDRKPPEIVEAARREKNKNLITPKKDYNELVKYFIMDAKDAINVLENFNVKTDSGHGDTDVKTYTTAVHGIKSALANIGETKLSEAAFELEKAGRTHNMDIAAEKTPAFVKKLKSLIERLNQEETISAAAASHDDMLYLKEKLPALKTACETFNIISAETILKDLKQKTWPQEAGDAINEISVNFLLGEFEKAAAVAERLINSK
ncbi:MAG: response regulator [Treponema sp.]|jgi:PAS domain S-box-containing protein|nr:response regulator [Treponema sp.]